MGSREQVKPLVSLIRTASIEEYEKSTQLPREIPLIGLAELHRTIFKCDVEGWIPTAHSSNVQSMSSKIIFT